MDAFAKNRTVLDSSSTQRASMKNLFTSPDEVSKEEKKNDDDDDDKDEGKKSTFLRAAKHLNNMICERSGDTSTSLVVINLPLTRRLRPVTFVEYTETLTKGLRRVLLVRGTGSEFISSVA